MTKPRGYLGMFTPYVWMFIKSHENLRRLLYATADILTLIQFEYSAFAEATVPVCTFVVQNGKTGLAGQYLRLVDFPGGMEVQRVKALEAINNPYCTYCFTTDTDLFAKMPGSPVAYWISDKIASSFVSGCPFEQLAPVKQGLATTDNNKYLRFWHEVSHERIGFGMQDLNAAIRSGYKWFPYNKGGEYRKWYGNNEYIVNYSNDGQEIKEDVLSKYPYLKTPDFVVKNTDYYFKPSLTWSFVSSSYFGVRCSPGGAIFDVGGSSAFPNDAIGYYLLGFLCSKLSYEYMKMLNPTLNFQVGNVASLPIIVDMEKKPKVDILSEKNVDLSKKDWDSFETSWDFRLHPLIGREVSTVKEAYLVWENEAAARFETLKANEEENNRTFIDIYGLENELAPEVDDKDVTVRLADLGRDIRSLISYAVGCMFGRYSLDVEGLAYAGGNWNAGRYKTFLPDSDNILPVGDDEYFDDDIVARFVDFIRVAYGPDTLEFNLEFIANALGGKGSPRQVIRDYFLRDFYADHCRTCKKRPIYWLFDSGKKNGFKALIYVHRYSRDLLARLRTGYVHEQQERYRTQLANIGEELIGATGAERARLLRQQNKLTEQARELDRYEEKIHHLADMNISIDLDDGVKNNYAIFSDVLAKIR